MGPHGQGLLVYKGKSVSKDKEGDEARIVHDNSNGSEIMVFMDAISNEGT